MAKVKAVIQTGVPASKKRYRKNLNRPDSHGGGIFQDRILEAHPHYNAAPSEAVTEGENNNFIVLGRDRPKGLKSGYGGKGDTHSGKIDIVVGMQGINVKEESEDGQRLYTDPDLILDAARIYISQKTDVDDNFHLKDGKVGNVKTRSAIAIKADGVRVIGREGIKLVTGTDKYNSQGVEISAVSGIDLIAGNRDLITSKIPDPFGEPQQIQYLQPIPKGYNLEEALKSITQRVMRLNSVVQGLCRGIFYLIGPATTVKPVVTALAPGVATPNIDDIIDVLSFAVYTQKAMADLRWQGIKLTDMQENYLEVTGYNYINSRHNRTN